jgi:hypothetical protein
LAEDVGVLALQEEIHHRFLVAQGHAKGINKNNQSQNRERQKLA